MGRLARSLPPRIDATPEEIAHVASRVESGEVFWHQLELDDLESE